jgi:hypothetical protein
MHPTIRQIKMAISWAEGELKIDALAEREYEQGDWGRACGTTCCIYGAARIIAGLPAGPPKDDKRAILIPLREVDPEFAIPGAKAIAALGEDPTDEAVFGALEEAGWDDGEIREALAHADWDELRIVKVFVKALIAAGWDDASMIEDLGAAGWGEDRIVKALEAAGWDDDRIAKALGVEKKTHK